MAFKRSDERMQRVTERLRQRMAGRGVDEEAQRKIIDSIGSFALYGFPESHAISFALIAYASCWLKAHHPAAFYSGLLNHQPMGFYSVNTLLEDARRHGVRVKAVCCVASGLRTDLEDGRTIRLGLNRLKGLAEATALRVVAERQARDFDSLEDFLRRVRPTAAEKRLLARAGALNALEGARHRRQALWQVELPLHDDLLQACGGGGEGPPMALMSPGERLAADFATLGATTGAHPMKLWRDAHGGRSVQRAADLARLPAGIPVSVAGMAICRQRPGTAKGHCFISLEDETGIANLFVHRETFHRLRLLISAEDFLLAHGVVQRSEGDQATVYVREIEPLPGE
jgi:error-prone DNA polymerase